MSGVYIRRMEMPTSCFYCPFRRKGDPDDIMCIVTREVFEETFAGTIETRNRGNCPLVPVPEHGRLIDADAVAERFWDGQCYFTDAIKRKLQNAPTIIPADGNDTNVPTREEDEDNDDETMAFPRIED